MIFNRKISQNTSHIWAFGMMFSHLCYVPEAEWKVKDHKTLSTRPTTHWASVSELSGFADMRNLAEWLQLDSFWEHYPSSLCWCIFTRTVEQWVRNARSFWPQLPFVCAMFFLWKTNPTNKLKEKEETPQNVDTTLAKQRKLRKISWYQS